MTSKNDNTKRDAVLLEIARKLTSFETLETVKSGADFKECAVWTIRQALEAAYAAGVASVAQPVRSRRSDKFVASICGVHFDTSDVEAVLDRLTMAEEIAEAMTDVALGEPAAPYSAEEVRIAARMLQRVICGNSVLLRGLTKCEADTLAEAIEGSTFLAKDGRGASGRVKQATRRQFKAAAAKVAEVVQRELTLPTC